MSITCPTLKDQLNSELCQENLAGLGNVAYIFDKNDLTAPLTRTENVYATPTFKSGKGLYKFDLKDDSQQIQGSSLGFRKGFSLSLNFVIEQVSKAMGVNARALNNLDLGIIVPDGDDFQIMYDANRKGKFDSDGIKSDTGTAASDDRQTTGAYKLEPVLYPNLYVTAPTSGGFDSLLASAAGEE